MKKLCAFIFFGLCLQGFSNPRDPETDSLYDQLTRTFSTITNVEHFGESLIPGIYEVIFNGKTIYYYPEKEILVFGEMFNKEGVSLTEISRQQNSTKRKLEDFDYSKGLVMGDEDGVPVVEILNPDCFYCRKFDEYITLKSQSTRIKRIVFFNTDTPEARRKANHIFCAEKPEEALTEVMHGEVSDLLTCDQAEKRSQDHQAEIRKLDISSTPSFILGGALVRGFNEGVIDEYIESTASNY